MIDNFKNELIEVLKLLSAKSDDQLYHWEELGLHGNVDEFALEFEDVFPIAQRLCELAEIAEADLEQLKKLDAMLDLMSGEKKAAL